MFGLNPGLDLCTSVQRHFCAFEPPSRHGEESFARQHSPHCWASEVPGLVCERSSMGQITPTGRDAPAGELQPTPEQRDEAIQALMQQIHESVAILRALRAKHSP